MMRKLLCALATGFCVHCSSSPPAQTTDSGTDGATRSLVDASVEPTCSGLPVGATLEQGSSSCSSRSGTYTAFTINVTKNTYIQTSNVPEADLDKDQADFDLHEGTTTEPNVKVKSNADYVRTTTCATGSTMYTAPGEQEVRLRYLWQKTP